MYNAMTENELTRKFSNEPMYTKKVLSYDVYAQLKKDYHVNSEQNLYSHYYKSPVKGCIVIDVNHEAENLTVVRMPF